MTSWTTRNVTKQKKIKINKIKIKKIYWKIFRRNHFLCRSENWLEFVGAILIVIGVLCIFLALSVCCTVLCCILGLCNGARSWNGCPPWVNVMPVGPAVLIACCVIPLTRHITKLCQNIYLSHFFWLNFKAVLLNLFFHRGHLKWLRE